MGETGGDSSPPASERLARMEAELSKLASGVQVLAANAPIERHSLPVRAAVGGYRFTKNATAILGVLACLAELLSDNYGPFRAIWRALVVRDADAVIAVPMRPAPLIPLDP